VLTYAREQHQRESLGNNPQVDFRKGISGATTREIAHQVGVTELTLFRNFEEL